MDPVTGRLIRLPLRQGALSADAVFEDMLTGWKQQQLARNFTAGTGRAREGLVRRFVDHTGHFPWDWTVGDADEFFGHERSILNLAFATVRAYQTHLKVFCDYLTNPAYEWDRICILTIAAIRQAHINEYLAAGPSTRYATRTFLVWLLKNKEITKLEIPHRYAATKPLISQQQRVELIRRCLESNETPLTTRVAALILLLFGQPVGKIAALKCSDLQALPDGLHLRLGKAPVLVPAQIAPMFWDYLHHRPNQQTSNGKSQWLSPALRQDSTFTVTR